MRVTIAQHVTAPAVPSHLTLPNLFTLVIFLCGSVNGTKTLLYKPELYL